MHTKLKFFFRTVAKLLKLRRPRREAAGESLESVFHEVGEDEFYDSEYEEGDSIFYFSRRPDLLEFESYSDEEDSLLFEPIPGFYFLHLEFAVSED